MSRLAHLPRGLKVQSFLLGLATMLLVLPLHDGRPQDPRTEYETALQEFAHGQLAECQRQADLGYHRFLAYDPQWASRFLLLEAEAMEWRGTYDDALQILRDYHPAVDDLDGTIRQLAIQGIALARQHHFDQADEKLTKGEGLCAQADHPACGDAFRARAISQTERGEFSLCRQSFLKALGFAESHHDRLLETSSALNLGWTALQLAHYDESVDWLDSAYRASVQLGDLDLTEKSAANLGWAYFGLGDSDRALGLFLEAQNDARKIGNTGEELRRLIDAGYVRQRMDDFQHATDSYDQAFTLAKQINSKEDIINSLEVLAHLSIEMQELDKASGYLDQLLPLVRATPNRLDDLDVELAQGRIAAARGQDAQAESIFRNVEADPDSQTTMRLGAEHELARLYEHEGNDAQALRMYQAALITFEQARQQLKKEDSKLPFLANAAPIYDDYIALLVKQGHVDEALALADHSRARTLAQGVGLAIPVQPAALHAGAIARKAGATLLFYWLGPTQSYLWAITPQKTTLFPLPPEAEITRLASRYRSALLGPDNPIEPGPPESANPASANPDGLALYRALVAPAAGLIRPGSNVVILGDGPLTQLNFETLIVPAPHPHYWIEDANVIAAPSLYMLASAKSSAQPSSVAARNVLLLGDALSPDPDYPALPKAPEEMREIERHFAAAQETILTGPGANPEAYLASTPQQFAYIHFVAHGVASLTDPLDSAIILSPSNTTEDSFKLYARAIIQHPLHARLVTISSCYGGGTRSYAGEGLVGLSWAFLRAGAHNVIGALWEVSDDSTPALMDSLYQGLEQGLPPSVALRQAKLALLHQHPEFRSPFFWAPFQIYTGL
jgi:tetratricopeptide (TPR) repeat protein